MQEILNDTTTWFTISFFIFIFLMWKVGGKSIAAALDSHSEKVKQELEQAAALHAEAAQLLADTEAKHTNALKESDAIIARAEEQAHYLRTQAEKDLDATLKRIEQQAIERITMLQEQAIAEVRAQAVDTALKATDILLRSNLDIDHDTKLIEQQTAHMVATLKKVA